MLVTFFNLIPEIQTPLGEKVTTKVLFYICITTCRGVKDVILTKRWEEDLQNVLDGRRLGKLYPKYSLCVS